MKKTEVFNAMENTFKKRVSYIMATYNRAERLEKSLDNASKFITDKDELIIIDGGSTDTTLKVLNKFSWLVDLFLTEKDINQVHATNKGMLLARGKYIKILTDDDLIYPDSMEKAIAVLDRHPEIDLLVCGGEFKIGDTKEIVTLYPPPGCNYGSNIEDLFRYGGAGIGFVIRKSSVAKTGLFTLDWIADTEYLVRCVSNKFCFKFCRIKMFRAHYHSGSVGNLHVKEVDKETFEILQKYTGKRFFWRYRLNRLLYQHPTVEKFLFLPLQFFNLYRAMRYSGSKMKNKISYRWDGGFS